jgi:hypothetical protein
MLFIAITAADLERRDELVRVSKNRFRIGPPEGLKIHDVFVPMKCKRTVWVIEADTAEQVFEWFSPLQPYYDIQSIEPALRLFDLWDLYARGLGELVDKVQEKERDYGDMEGLKM